MHFWGCTSVIVTISSRSCKVKKPDLAGDGALGQFISRGVDDSMSPASSSPVSPIEANETPNAAPLAAIPLHKNRAEPNGSDGSFVVEPQENRYPPAPVTTDFCALPDGSLVELVQLQNRGKSELSFLIWNGETVSAVDRFERDGYLHTPPLLDQKFSEDLNLRLPSGA